jgi:hypothetical protein
MGTRERSMSERNLDSSPERKANPKQKANAEQETSSTRGRPKKPEQERRTLSHGLYLSKQEKEELERLAEAADLSVNEYLRRSALGGTPVELSSDQKARRELRAIGRRLDRLAEAAGEADMEALAERLRSGIEDLRDTLARIE